MSKPIDLRSLSLAALQALTAELGLPRYRAAQIFSWVHGHGVRTTEPMTNLSRTLRARLAQQFELSSLAVDALQRSTDGTLKLRLRCHDALLIESVLIPQDDRLTLCLSSQAGCALGCRFCATATMGMRRNLTAGEIVDQVYRARAHLDDGQRISNLVFMGMGEPLANLDNVLLAADILCTDIGANFSTRRITVSTVGMVPAIVELGRRAPSLGLAISLHATTDEVRSRLMPINRRHNLSALMAALRAYPLPKRRRITFEYVMLAGINDSDADARRLPRLLDGIPAKVNLLPYNPSRPDQPALARPDEAVVERFAESLRAKGLHTTVRRSRGLDIAAACGQLAAPPSSRSAS